MTARRLARARLAGQVAAVGASSPPEWVTGRFRPLDWWDGGEQVPPEVLVDARSHAASNPGLVHAEEEFVYWWRRCRARQRWKLAAAAWCKEHGYPETIVGFGPRWYESVKREREGFGV